MIEELLDQTRISFLLFKIRLGIGINLDSQSLKSKKVFNKEKRKEERVNFFKILSLFLSLKLPLLLCKKTKLPLLWGKIIKIKIYKSH